MSKKKKKFIRVNIIFDNPFYVFAGTKKKLKIPPPDLIKSGYGTLIFYKHKSPYFNYSFWTISLEV